MDLIVWDTLGRPGRTAVLRARLERGWFFRGRPGRPVLVRRLTGPAAEPASTVELITDARGCVAFAFTPPTVGTYVFEFESPSAPGAPPLRTAGVVLCCNPARAALAVDVDGTLTDRATTLTTGAAGARLRDEFTTAAAGRLAVGFDWLYVTGRRRRQHAATRDWIARHGLPTAPLLQHMPLLPVPGFISARWKRRLLTGLRPEQPSMTVGIGNTAGDAAAYAAAGMLPLIFTRRPINGIAVTSWRQVEEFLLADRLDLAGPTTVVLSDGAVRITLEPGGAECSLTRTTAQAEPERSVGPWPVVRAALLASLACRPRPALR